jgi:hypothetical protein
MITQLHQPISVFPDLGDGSSLVGLRLARHAEPVWSCGLRV